MISAGCDGQEGELRSYLRLMTLPHGLLDDMHAGKIRICNFVQCCALSYNSYSE